MNLGGSDGLKILCMFVVLVGESLLVSLLMFRLGTCSNNLHKIAKNIDVNTEEDKYSDRYGTILDDMLIVGILHI